MNLKKEIFKAVIFAAFPIILALALSIVLPTGDPVEVPLPPFRVN